MTKYCIIKFIKEHGHEYFNGEYVATINGIKVGVCKSIIILYDDGYKFPPFSNVTLYEDGELEFYTNGKYNSYYPSMRDNEIVDKYFKVMEYILNEEEKNEEAAPTENEEKNKENIFLTKVSNEDLAVNISSTEENKNMEKTLKTNLTVSYTFSELLRKEIVGGRYWEKMGYFDDVEFEDGNYYYFSNWYGSNGGYYIEDKDEIMPSYKLESMEPEKADKIQHDNIFVEEPILTDVYEPRAGHEIEREYAGYRGKCIDGYGKEVIRDINGKTYSHGGVYQYLNEYFYPVELVEEKGKTEETKIISKKDVIDYIKKYGLKDHDGYHVRIFNKNVELKKRTITVDGAKLKIK